MALRLQDAEVRADRKMFNAFGLDIATKKVIEPTRLVKRSPTHALDPSRDARTGSGDSETSSGGWGSLEIDDGGSSSSAIQMDEVIPGYKLVGPGSASGVPTYRCQTLADRLLSRCRVTVGRRVPAAAELPESVHRLSFSTFPAR